LTEALTITTTPRTDHQLDVTIQLGPERTEAALHRAARLVAHKTKISGFRPGKAPDTTVIRLFGRDKVLREIMNDLGQEVYKEVLEGESFEPYAQAQLEDVQFDPITFKLVVPLLPTVDLGDYRSIRLDAPEVNVSEADVAAALAGVRDKRVTWQTVERPAEIGDTVVMDIRGTVGEDIASAESDEEIDEDAESDEEDLADEDFAEDEDDDDDDFDTGVVTIMDNKDWELLLKPESGWLPGFDEAFVGMAAGNEKTFALTYPKDSASRYRGQAATFQATIKEVRGKLRPELDDEFAKTLAEMTAQRAAEAEARLNDAGVAALIEKATLSYPPVAVDEVIHEIIKNLESQLERTSYNLEDYLRLQGTTLEAYRGQVAPQAERRLQSRLVLTALTKVEGITVTDEETQAELKCVTADSKSDDEKKRLRDGLSSEQGQALIRQDLMTKKTLARLRAIVTGQAPELVQPEAGQPEAEAAVDVETPSAEAAEVSEVAEAVEDADVVEVAEAAEADETHEGALATEAVADTAAQDM